MIITVEMIKQIIKEEFDYGRIPLKLSTAAANPKKAKFVSNSGQGDSNPDDDKVAINLKAKEAVKTLKPSQSSMSIDKALGMLTGMLHNKYTGEGDLQAGGNLGAFISSDNHIMDGHHRWISTAMVDPRLSVGGYKVGMTAEPLIAILNTITVGKLGIMKGKSGTGGFKQFTNGGLIAKKLLALLTNGTDFLSAEQIKADLQKYVGTSEDVDSKVLALAATKKIVKHMSMLTFQVPPNAPARMDMPVIDPDMKAGADKIAIKALQGGEVDWNAPFADPKGATKQKEAPKLPAVTESKPVRKNSKSMRVTQDKLEQIIKEETKKTLHEQGSFTTSGPDTEWALTVGQIGAMKASGKKDVLASLSRNIDLKGVLMNATQGSHPDFLDLLELPEFQKDSRVKEHGY